MTKIVLSNVANLTDSTTATNVINNNSATLVTAFDNTLSRDGTQPNTMGANLDMNANHLLNLPAPLSSNEPARLQDLANVAAGGSVVLSNLPTGGTVNQLLTKNSSTNFDASWQTAATVPTGGTTSQALVKNSNANFDDGWQGVVNSIAGNTGAFTLTGGITNTVNAVKLALNNATAQTNPSNPSSISSLSFVMMGLGATCTLTPVYSTRLKFEFIATMSNTVINDGVSSIVRWGTGTAPVFGVAPAGNAIGSTITATAAVASALYSFNNGGIVTGLTPGVTYWFDISLAAVTGGNAFVNNISFNAFEF